MLILKIDNYMLCPLLSLLSSIEFLISHCLLDWAYLSLPYILTEEIRLNDLFPSILKPLH